MCNVPCEMRDGGWSHLVAVFLLGTHISSGGFPCLRFLLHISAFGLAQGHISHLGVGVRIAAYISHLGMRQAGHLTSHISVYGHKNHPSLSQGVKGYAMRLICGVCAFGVFQNFPAKPIGRFAVFVAGYIVCVYPCYTLHHQGFAFIVKAQLFIYAVYKLPSILHGPLLTCHIVITCLA